VLGLEDQRRFSLPFVQPCTHSLNIGLNALGRFNAIVAREQVLFNMLDFAPRERAEQIRLQRLVVGVPTRYCMHSSTPLLINRFRNFSERWSKSVKGGVLFALTIHEEGGRF